MALNKILTKELNEILYPKNDFIQGNAMFDAQGASVHRVEVNESQEVPHIQENASVFPLPVHSTEDAVKSYDIDSLSTEATFINDVDELLTVFSKRASELGKHAKAMQLQYHDKIANLWALPVGVLDSSILETTGAAAAVINGDMTGTRKQMTKKDIVKAKTILAKQNVETENHSLVGLMDTAMYYNLYELPEFIQYDINGKVDPIMGGGAIGELFGIRLYVRNGTTSYTKTLSAKNDYLNADGTRRVPATDDKLFMMIWNPAYVRYSFGNEKIFTELGSPVYQGDVFSTLLRCGGMRSRIDNKGVVMIVQDWVS